jgi:hypothetical protein
LYKIVKGGKAHKQQIISYDEAKGLAKSVANDGTPIMTNNALTSKKFLASVDDPKGDYSKLETSTLPVSILSVPVYLCNDNPISSNCLGKYIKFICE